MVVNHSKIAYFLVLQNESEYWKLLPTAYKAW